MRAKGARKHSRQVLGVGGSSIFLAVQASKQVFVSMVKEKRLSFSLIGHDQFANCGFYGVGEMAQAWQCYTWYTYSPFSGKGRMYRMISVWPNSTPGKSRSRSSLRQTSLPSFCCFRCPGMLLITRYLTMCNLPSPGRSCPSWYEWHLPRRLRQTSVLAL